MLDALMVIVTIAIEPASSADHGALEAALAALAAEDPSLQVMIDRESGQISLGGQGELHLDEAIDRLRRDDGIELRIGAPQVAYRETIIKRIEKDYTYKKQGQFARVKMIFEPHAAGSAFESKIVGGAVPDEYLPGVEKGIASVMGAGVLAGFPVADVKATLIDGACHDVDSSVFAFEIAARAAFREALAEAGPVLLEPVMTVEITTPDDYTGFVMGDLLARRGEVLAQRAQGGAIVIDANVPLANLFGYINQLRSGTQGRASFTMVFAGYRPVDPPSSTPPRFPPAAALRVA